MDAETDWTLRILIARAWLAWRIAQAAEWLYRTVLDVAEWVGPEVEVGEQ